VDQDEDDDLPCQRVLVMKEVDMVLMFTARCTTEAVGNDPRLLNLMVDIADSCVKRLRLLMKDITSQNIAADNMDTLPLSDGRQTKEHLEELSQQVNETVALTDVAFRMQPPDGVYLGTFVQGTVVAKRNYAIGKVGVVAVLTKKSKFATVEAFSEQLCEHIASTRPANLGTVRGANTKNMSKSAMAKLQAAQRDQLLLQNFIFDPTIMVAEAARRSFVKIDGFLLFK
jgi:translation elongation factor EF-Ts